MAHRDAVVDRDRVELLGDPAGPGDRLRDERAEVSQVHMPRYELGEAVGDRDDRLAEIVVGHPGGPPESARTGHVATMGRSLRSQFGHGVKSCTGGMVPGSWAAPASTNRDGQLCRQGDVDATGMANVRHSGVVPMVSGVVAAAAVCVAAAPLSAVILLRGRRNPLLAAVLPVFAGSLVAAASGGPAGGAPAGGGPRAPGGGVRVGAGALRGGRAGAPPPPRA